MCYSSPDEAAVGRLVADSLSLVGVVFLEGLASCRPPQMSVLVAVSRSGVAWLVVDLLRLVGVVFQSVGLLSVPISRQERRFATVLPIVG